MKRSYHIKLSFLIILAMFLGGIAVYQQLPEQVPSHWNVAGEVDDYSGRFAGAFALPIISLIIVLILIVVPKLDPLKKQFSSSLKYYDGFILIFSLFFGYIYLLTLIAAFNENFNLTQFMIPAMGGFFYYIGIILPKIKQNWFMGIRTPWTISNEKVWTKTHALGGTLFKLSGFLTLLGVFAPDYWFILLMAPILITSLILIIYSYLIFRQVSKSEL